MPYEGYYSCKCSSGGTIFDSHRVFNNANERDDVIWTSMVACYAQQGDKEAVFQLFNQMQVEGVKPNSVTCLMICLVCSSPDCLKDGKKIHTFILGSGMQFNLALTNTIIDMYVKCRRLNYACCVFDVMVNRDVVSWNVMITAHVEAGLNEQAVMLLEKMQKGGVPPNQLTYVAVLKGCVQLMNIELGMQVHACIMENSLQVDDFLHSNLAAMYAKCGSLKDAESVLDDMDKADVVSRTALIAGYSKNGEGKEALALFEKMKREGVEPDELAFICTLRASAVIGALQHGKRIHEDIRKSSLCCNVLVKNALMDMYANCGSLNDASDVFASMEAPDILSWNEIISGYAHQGAGKQALLYFDKMLAEGIKPDATTFLAVLNACRHVGLVEQGHCHFESMSREHGILPTMDHYASMVDLLCRAGHTDRAEAFILEMVVEPDESVWMALLGGCRYRGHVETAKRAYRQIIKLNPTLPGAYVTLANIFAMGGMWNDLAEVRKEMDAFGFCKQAEQTYIELEDEIAMFSKSDRSHPQAKDIQTELNRPTDLMKEAGSS
ncbi:hypothetical protein GOP47_0020439 [Adiantum capillus-veneris]|uniref:Pentatricopeptide repeat-containing protein n=1 Tax=Adiantum capillus-veneris TaxID=13818 RepID=A0A9D4UEB6_ADICA|nr:hypothetical protein GOP47_0020439 [Adiantum capillus-veneris]